MSIEPWANRRITRACWSIRITKSGLVRHRSANHKHLRSGKGGKRLRHLHKDPMMSSPEAKHIEKLLFRHLRRPVAAARFAAEEPLARSAQKALKAEKAAAKAAGAAPAAKVAKKASKKATDSK